MKSFSEFLKQHYRIKGKQTLKLIDKHSALGFPPNQYLNLFDNNDKLKKKISAFDSLLSKFKTPQQFHVYHLSWQHPKTWDNVKVEGSKYILSTTQPLSTALGRKTMEKGQKGLIYSLVDMTQRGPPPMKHMLKIKIPKGSPGFYIEPHSRVPHEKEFALPRNSIIHIDRQPYKIDTKKSLIHWRGTLINKE